MMSQHLPQFLGTSPGHHQGQVTTGPQLSQKKKLTTQQSLELMEFCLYSTYLLFQGSYYEQLKDVAMGSPVGPIVANLYMEFFKDKALRTSQNSPRLWKKVLNNTFAIQYSEHKDYF